MRREAPENVIQKDPKMMKEEKEPLQTKSNDYELDNEIKPREEST